MKPGPEGGTTGVPGGPYPDDLLIGIMAISEGIRFSVKKKMLPLLNGLSPKCYARNLPSGVVNFPALHQIVQAQPARAAGSQGLKVRG